jgi:anti-sigma factor RsiW
MKLLHRDLVCREAVALASDYLEGTLTKRQRRRFERHLAACDGCDAYLAQLREALAVSGSVEPEALDPETVDGLVDLFHRFRHHDD